MAVQFHVAHSSEMDGAGIIAGGPYWCCMDDPIVGATMCSRDVPPIPLDLLYAATDSAELLKSIDPTSNLQNSKVLLFSGLNDTVVLQPVMRKLEQYYQHYIINPQNIVSIFNISCPHAMITDNYGEPCAHFGSPFINNCSYDLAGAILRQIYGNLKPRVEPVLDNIVMVKQSDFVPLHDPALFTSLAKIAYVYYPTGCSRSPTNCTRVHVVFHGCLMTVAEIGDALYAHGGYIQWAESNQIVVVFPQLVRDDLVNPLGCWDFWGYTGLDFATKFAIQIATVYNMAMAS